MEKIKVILQSILDKPIEFFKIIGILVVSVFVICLVVKFIKWAVGK